MPPTPFLIQCLFLAGGLALLGWGYLRRSRNAMLVAALSMFLGGSFAELAERTPGILRVAIETSRALDQEDAAVAARRAEDG